MSEYRLVNKLNSLNYSLNLIIDCIKTGKPSYREGVQKNKYITML